MLPILVGLTTFFVALVPSFPRRDLLWAVYCTCVGLVVLMTLLALAVTGPGLTCARVKALNSNTVIFTWWSLLSSFVSVMFLFASTATCVAFVLRAVFDITKRVRTLFFSRDFHAVVRTLVGGVPGRGILWLRGVLVVLSVTMFFLWVHYSVRVRLGYTVVFGVFSPAIPDVVYLLLMSMLFLVDFTLSTVSDVRLMPMMSAYGGSLAWNLGVDSVDIVFKSMVNMILEEQGRLVVGGYEYLREGQGVNRVPRVGQRAVVMVADDTDDAAVVSLSCHVGGTRKMK